MRLNAFLARAGIASRRKADEIIKDGRVSVNGAPAQLNSQVQDGDVVAVDGKVVEREQLTYVLLNKPAGTITSLNDPEGRPTVIGLLGIDKRVVPVGRLDFDTTGALLLTNDGDLAHKLMHPSFEVEKIYEAEVTGPITNPKLRQLEQGVELEDGKTAPAKARKLTDNKIEISVHEGRKHQVKRMLAAVELNVKQLHRVAYAGLSLEGLAPGQWRELTNYEVNKLKMVQ